MCLWAISCCVYAVLNKRRQMKGSALSKSSASPEQAAVVSVVRAGR